MVKYKPYIVREILSKLKFRKLSKSKISKKTKLNMATVRRYVDYMYRQGMLHKRKTGYKNETVYWRK